MKSRSRAVATIVVALVVGATVPGVSSVPDFSTFRPSGMVGTPGAHAEFATGPVLTRIVPSKQVERDTLGAFAVSSQPRTSNLLRAAGRIVAPSVTPDSHARASRHGRAPPV